MTEISLEFAKSSLLWQSDSSVVLYSLVNEERKGQGQSQQSVLLSFL